MMYLLVILAYGGAMFPCIAFMIEDAIEERKRKIWSQNKN